MLTDLLKKSRSYRRFYQNQKITKETLESLIELTRYTPSGGNQQPLKYRLVHQPEENQKVFDTLKWAAALPDWDGPDEGERPAGYIVILCDKTISSKAQWDEGITAQTILLGAAEAGLGGCILGSVNRPLLAEYLGINQEQFAVSLVLALGKPKEAVSIVPVTKESSVTYYRDENQVHYVPKRELPDLLV